MKALRYESTAAPICVAIHFRSRINPKPKKRAVLSRTESSPKRSPCELRIDWDCFQGAIEPVVRLQSSLLLCASLCRTLGRVTLNWPRCTAGDQSVDHFHRFTTHSEARYSPFVTPPLAHIVRLLIIRASWSLPPTYFPEESVL